jgi:hypothetical protein
LEYPHFIVSDENGRLDIVAVFQFTTQVSSFSAGHALGSFIRTDLDVVQNFFELIVRRLGAHHRFREQRVSQPDVGDALDRSLKEFVKDGFLHQRPRWASADLAFVKCEEGESFQSFI